MKQWEREIRKRALEAKLQARAKTQEAEVGGIVVAKRSGMGIKWPTRGQEPIKPGQRFKVLQVERRPGGTVLKLKALDRPDTIRYAMARLFEFGSAKEIYIDWIHSPMGTSGRTRIAGFLKGAKSRASLYVEKRGNNYVAVITGAPWGYHKVIASGPTPQAAQAKAERWAKANIS